MADTAAMQTTTPTKAVATPKQANLLACRQWWKVCFLYGDQEKYYRQVYGRAASQRVGLRGTGCPDSNNESQQLNKETASTKNCNQTANKNNNLFASSSLDASNNSSNENLLNAVESASTAATNNKSLPNKEMLLFPHKNHKGILIRNNNRGRTLDPHTQATDLTQQMRNNSRVTVLDDPFLLGGHGATTTHDSKDSGINNIDDSTPPPPLPAKSIGAGAHRGHMQQQQPQRSPQQQRFQNQKLSNELFEQLNGGFDFDLLTFQLANNGNTGIMNLAGGERGGVVVNQQLHHQKYNSWTNNGHNSGSAMDSTAAPQMWRNYGGGGDNHSPNGTVPRGVVTTNAGVSSCGGNGANNGLCSQIDKILEHNLQPNES